MDTKPYPQRTMPQPNAWQEGTRSSLKETLEDPVASKLLLRSNLTRAQFETLLIDQLGHEMANRRLTRNEMAHLVRSKKGISRGALNRTLKQARQNISEAIHTVLLLGYGGLFENPSLIPLIDASDQLRSQMPQLKELYEQDKKLYKATIENLLESLEEAFQAIYQRS